MCLVFDANTKKWSTNHEFSFNDVAAVSGLAALAAETDMGIGKASKGTYKIVEGDLYCCCIESSMMQDMMQEWWFYDHSVRQWSKCGQPNIKMT